MKIKRKSPLTIIEVMIVIFIISIVGGVMSYNMKGSLVKGRAFKTEAASREAYDILSLGQASGTTIKEIIDSPEKVLKASGLVKSTKKLLSDGWGKEFVIIPAGSDDFIIYSERWITYLQEEKNMDLSEIEENFPWAYNISAVGDETSS